MSAAERAASAGQPQERSTRQKRAIAAVLNEADGFQSAQELHLELRRRGEHVGLTTVYNQLRSLAEGGDVDVLRPDGGEALYRRCAAGGHHHHLVCRVCGRSVEVMGADIEQWTARVGQENGFSDVSHTVEVFGTCGPCARRAGPRSDD